MSLQHPVFYAVLMLVAGLGIPIGAALNAYLGAKLQSPVLAAAILFGVGFLAGMIIVVILGELSSVSRLFSLLDGAAPDISMRAIPLYAFCGGLFILFYVLNVTWVAPKFGVGNAVAFVLLGQMISMAAIDHFALMGATHHPMTFQRMAGLGLMVVGVFMAVRRF